ncbi:MAG: hypothetical protein GXP30_14830, partial [Verrucomicrobia bacterium]|nr:hypothetical protein [Verrucomicrobiota bacterium]
IMLADAGRLKEIENGAEQESVLGETLLSMFRSNLAIDMDAHAGKRTIIRCATMYHMGIPLYELEGLDGFWPESAIVDFSIKPRPEHASYSRADEWYHAQADVKSGRGVVQILDFDNRVFCSFCKENAKECANTINAVSRIRSKCAFEIRYGFDGEYAPPPGS